MIAYLGMSRLHVYIGQEAKAITSSSPRTHVGLGYKLKLRVANLSLTIFKLYLSPLNTGC